MALPPSRLTDLLSRAEKTPEGLMAALSGNGCLTPETVQAPAPLLALLAATLAEAGARPIMPGPSAQDLLAVVRRVTTPPHVRLIGFGQSHVYFVRIDADDQEFLERYKAIPAGKA